MNRRTTQRIILRSRKCRSAGVLARSTHWPPFSCPASDFPHASFLLDLLRARTPALQQVEPLRA